MSNHSKQEVAGLPVFSSENRERPRIGRVVALFCLLALLAVMLGALFSFAAADVLGLHKTYVSAEVQVANETDAVAYGKTLAAAGVVRYPHLFSLVTRLRGDFLPIAGSYTVDNTMDYPALWRAVCFPTKARKEITVTIPPGTTVPRLIAIFTEAGVGDAEAWARAINEREYDYDFLPPKGEKTWRLEGYLFPDTYRVWQDSDPSVIVGRMLANFERKFDERYRDRAKTIGRSVDEIVTIASMIEAESRYPDEYARIAAVFYNRLASRNYPYLESDATVQYALPAHKEQLTRDDLATDSPYNTYTRKGLPAGAICNPGADALLYALFPAKTRDYFFVSGGGRALFAENYAGHKQNIARILREAENATA